MNCPQTRELYSEYRDGLLSGVRRRRVESHLGSCPECCRFYSRVDESLCTLEHLADITPSPGFRFRLFRRLKNERDLQAVMPGRTKLAAAMMVAAALGMFLIEDGSHTPPLEQTPAARASTPLPIMVAKASYPFVTFADLNAPVYEIGLTSTSSASHASLASWARLPR